MLLTGKSYSDGFNPSFEIPPCRRPCRQPSARRGVSILLLRFTTATALSASSLET